MVIFPPTSVGLCFAGSRGMLFNLQSRPEKEIESQWHELDGRSVRICIASCLFW